MDPISALYIIVLGATPFFEARYAIPLAVMAGYPPIEAYLLGVVGNILPVIPLLLLLDPVSKALSDRFETFRRFFEWLFCRTRVHSASFERWGTLALFFFVAAPIPMTGAWSGCAAAFIFGIRFLPAFVAIAAGTMVAALITTLPILGFYTVLGVG